MAAPTSILDTIFGHEFELPGCASCGGVGLIGIGGDEVPAICAECGGSGLSNVFDPNFLARFRQPLADDELDEAAAEFGAALLQGIADVERLLEAGDLPLASARQPKVC